MIKAIETIYNGHRFRSRLEARWAVIFDALGIEWQYESQGFQCGGRVSGAEQNWAYLPDFWLPKEKLFVEVKGELTPEQHLRFMDNAGSLCDRNDSRMMLAGPVPATGLPRAYSMHKGCLQVSPALAGGTTLDGRWRRNSARASYVAACDVGGDWWDVTGEARDAHGHGFRDPFEPGFYLPFLPIGREGVFANAYNAGRMARFEHGESGAPIRI